MENGIEKTQLANGNATQMIPTQGAEATRMGMSITCPVCHSTTPEGEKYCSDCGFLLSSQPVETADMPEPPALPRIIDPTSGRESLLNPGENTIGRENSDVLVSHPTASRRHAKLTVSDGKYILEDLGSTNGTYVGNRKVEPGQPVEIKPGDEIRFGSAVMRLEEPASEAVIAAEEAVREVEEAEEREELAEESVEVEQAAEQPAPPSVEEENEEHEESHEAVEAVMKIEPGVESGFEATPEQALEEPVQPVEIHEELPALARLVPKAGGDELLVKQGENTVGRRPANDIVIADPYISGSHAVISASDGSFSVTDTGSTNGTSVNGERLSPNEPHALTDGDEVTFGQDSFRFTV
ncbi:MAG: FHA domain-containing protein [Armatimonadota bacterium]